MWNVVTPEDVPTEKLAASLVCFPYVQTDQRVSKSCNNLTEKNVARKPRISLWVSAFTEMTWELLTQADSWWAITKQSTWWGSWLSNVTDKRALLTTSALESLDETRWSHPAIPFSQWTQGQKYHLFFSESTLLSLLCNKHVVITVL